MAPWRKNLWPGMVAVGFLQLPSCGQDSGPTTPADIPPVSTSPGTDGAVPWVDPFIGTGDSTVQTAVSNGQSGSTFPGPSLPFGMVQFSPDTPHAAPPGYYYPDTQILGFSFTHLDGAGCAAMRDFPLLPIVGPIDVSTQPAVSFSHDTEIASPGFYEVTLDSGVKVDLTATARTGMARFTFPRGSDASVLLEGSFQRDLGQVFGFHAEVSDSGLVQGWRKNGFFCASNTLYKVYFAARFDHPFSTVGTWSNGELQPGTRTVDGLDSGVYFGFDTSDVPVVQLKLGLSYVSQDHALQNLDAENPDWDFDAVHHQAIATWNDRLGSVQVEGGTDDERRSFYTALYHVFLQPSPTSDVSGDYMAFDGTVGHAQDGARYSQYSGWDIYRSWIQLVAILAPNDASELMRSYVASGHECGALPKWPLENQDSSTMAGDPGPLLVANARAFGATDFDANEALTLAIHAANDPGAACGTEVVRDDLVDYLSRGYCPIDLKPPVVGPVSTTMEYAQADYAIAQLAGSLGDTATHDTFLARSGNWRNVFDPNRQSNGFSGYVQPRLKDDVNGAPAFQSVDVASDNGFVEGNAAQYTFMVPQDLPGLIEALGGAQQTVARLDAFFTEVNAGTDRPYLYIGNEPGFNAPWIYPAAGQPWKTQALTRRILKDAYAPTPGGLPGNDDLGATSSWLVWAMLGAYPAVPGVGGLVLGSPVFPKTTLSLGGGKSLVITADGVSDTAIYVQSVKVNGETADPAWIPWDKLAGGGTLEMQMGESPAGAP